ncbi:MAG: V-type ATP synthase subunit E [Chlamydiae bacterium CG10_big_fil_rev_8_21_14_0_10_42_34]|nr:MAG: V-type ATP synthase subunit E [Chlamydiae bacterium CG10_big_fil_rev_8_21_14_0_10_42_34]
MKGLETGKDKIQKICDSLRKETLEPAKQEAREIIENAHLQASEIVTQAKAKAAEMLEVATKEMEEKRRVFHASLSLACRQGIEQLKQKIEKELFGQELTSIIGKEMGDPKVIANLLNSFMKSMEEKGVEEDFAAHIPKEISPRLINELLAARVLDRLKDKTVVASEISGGLQIQIVGRQITIDMSDAAIRELIAQYIRRDLRELVFNV